MNSQLTSGLTSNLSPPSRQRRTTINLNRIARHVRTSCTCQEQAQSTEVTRLSNPAGRLPRLKCVLVFLQSEIRHPRWENTRTNNIDHDILRRQFRRRHLTQMDTRRLRRPICLCISLRPLPRAHHMYDKTYN
jgi:hypothetical protein